MDLMWPRAAVVAPLFTSQSPPPPRGPSTPVPRAPTPDLGAGGATMGPWEEKLNFMPLLHYYAKAESVHEIPGHIAVSEVFMKTVENECNRFEKIVVEMIVRKKSKLVQIYQRSHLESPFAGQVKETGSFCDIILVLSYRFLWKRR